MDISIKMVKYQYIVEVVSMEESQGYVKKFCGPMDIQTHGKMLKIG
jgi:hypothetical protein